MDPLPMAPQCALEEAGLRTQLERYRELAIAARLLTRTPQSLTLQLGPATDRSLVEKTIAVERECCPFFTIDWEPEQRQFTIAVSETAHEPALEAIAFALGLDALAA